MGKPLEGLLVLALEQAVAAPFCTMRLADAGARVIKIERPEGDFARFYDSAAGEGLSSYFVWLNRGKESLVADVKGEADSALFGTILERCDVFVQNLAPGAAARAGLGSAALRARHPRLITVDISGYGSSGDYAAMKAYDLLVQAESGLASVTGLPAGPGRVGISICDIACGASAHAAVLEALIERGRTGRGRAIEISLFDVIADWMNVPLLCFESTGALPARVGLAHPSICPYGAFATADGQQVLIAIQNEREWSSFCREFLGDPGFGTAPDHASNNARVAHRDAVDRRIADAFVSLTAQQAIARLKAANTAFGLVNDVAGLAAHSALRRARVTTPLGAVSLAAPPGRDGGALELGPVPAVGQHSANIRKEFMPSAGGAP
ncbi:MAG TPA: CaiB/BaiF CoA-transferase family protein [Lichenihabitans sp.]|jgi:crotonobetainyl-CoA:carnitine CoA-transferase CaiB-like acyl-CoA transferase|nr:CaiB/BaiF CoA-transferase family protein [Lichenihabitans sp.]